MIGIRPMGHDPFRKQKNTICLRFQSYRSEISNFRQRCSWTIGTV